MPETRTYAERVAQGCCGACGITTPDELPYCSSCKAKRAARKAAARAKARQAGKCPLCGKRKPAAGKVNCRKCQEASNAASRASHAKARREG